MNTNMLGWGLPWVTLCIFVAGASLVEPGELPKEFSWCDHESTNYCTKTHNQHLPHYCNSGWVFGSLSALADRIKILRKGKGIDINLSAQHVLNCGNVGTCQGGGLMGPYLWISTSTHHTVHVTGVAYETSNPYMACSFDSNEGFCPMYNKMNQTKCLPENIARSCDTHVSEGGQCVGLGWYPNATVDSFGTVSGFAAVQAEIYANGPVACGVDKTPLLNYTDGIVSDVRGVQMDHVISVVGWGHDIVSGPYWIVRNSWGEYWGEMGYARVSFGSLFIGQSCAWAKPLLFTTPENEKPFESCYTDGSNCPPSIPP